MRLPWRRREPRTRAEAIATITTAGPTDVPIGAIIVVSDEHLKVTAVSGCTLTVRPAEWWRWRLDQVRWWLRAMRWRILMWACR